MNKNHATSILRDCLKSRNLSFLQGYKRKYEEQEGPQRPSKRPSTVTCVDPQSFSRLSALFDNVRYQNDPGDLLSKKQWDHFKNTCQRSKEFSRKIQLWKILDQVLGSEFAASSHVFGSTLNGFGGRSSDMDICLFESHTSDPIQFLAQVRRVLRRKCATFLDYDIELVPAKVPILKMYDRVGQIEVDMSFGNETAVKNTHLLFTFSQVSL